MKIFQWMQHRLNGSNGKKRPNSISATSNYMLNEPCKQEFSDWPQALLAIGTFGNKNLKEDFDNNNTTEDSFSFQSCTQEFSLEQVENLEKEFNKNFDEENDEKKSVKISDESNNLYPNNNLAYSRGKERCSLNGSKRGVSKKSLIFLLKKMFICNSELPQTPLFKDPLSTESRMEKILRAILHKKIHPHGSSTRIEKKYLENNSMPQCDYYDDSDSEEEEELNGDVNKGSKWVKTDSEYIVLEI